MFHRGVPLIKLLIVIISIVTSLTAVSQTGNTKGIKLIVDTEVEEFISNISTPLLTAAGNRANSIKIHLIQDPRLNAFMTQGNRIFIHSGLILEAKTPDEISGVIAHEIGHNIGRHLARRKEAIDSANKLAILSGLLAATSAYAAKKSMDHTEKNVSTAIIASAQSLKIHSVLKYSHSQEFSADIFAVRILDFTKQTSKGLLTVLKKIKSKENISISNHDVYLSTHPVTQERIEILKNLVEKSPYYKFTYPEQTNKNLNRIKAKILAFTEPKKALQFYKKENSNFITQYARAISFHKLGDTQKSFKLLKYLINKYPKDPYLHELHGQFLFENGKLNDSIASYKKAIQLNQKKHFLLYNLAKVQISTNRKETYNEAINNLKKALSFKPELPGAWKQLSIAYGRLENYGQSALSSAELYLLLGNKKEALLHAVKATKLINIGEPARIRANDIVDHIRKIN